MENNVSNESQELNFQMIFAFVRQNYLKVLLRGVISLVIMLVLFALIFALMPARDMMSRQIIILLQKNKPLIGSHVGNQVLPCYPNLKPFLHSDIIHKAVLQEVYNRNKLEKRIKFDDFCTLFFISSDSLKRAQIENEYRIKLQQKNIRISDIEALQKDYNRNIAKIASDQLTISMERPSEISRTEAVKILNEIPVVWYSIFSKLEAPPLPQMPSLQSIIELRKNSDGYLTSLEKARIYNSQFRAVAEALDKLISDRQIIHRDGTTLGDLLTDFNNIERYQLRILRQYRLTTPELKSRIDEYYMRGTLEDLDRELNKIKAQQESAIEALNIISPRNENLSQSAGGKPASGELAIQMDSSFLTQFIEMVRNDTNSRLRAECAERLLEINNRYAAVSSEKVYMSNLLARYLAPAPRSSGKAVTQADFEKLHRELFNTLERCTVKLIQFREMIMKEYNADREFFVPLEDVSSLKEYPVSLKKLFLALVAICLLYNLIVLTVDFFRYTKEEKNV